MTVASDCPFLTKTRVTRHAEFAQLKTYSSGITPAIAHFLEARNNVPQNL
jgi:hypothetical protein